ncbi:hexosaminidase [Sinosporangium album]|uniref:beta-N-acetylhexosaminidase n=1 Tax=Sinosporangium album TaxID=504805 RepID=A0A1G8H305_9ACTN|nr:beta-N-acetylhexosaminidase [Sinosporangium album]SDI01007.1 hexosaminidase [Sinosporangium album]
MTDLLPRPRVVHSEQGSYELALTPPVSGPADLVDAVRLALAVLDPRPGEAGTIDVSLAVELGPEAYTLTVDANGVRIEAGDRSGAFYAAQTLRQLLPAAAYRTSPLPGVRWTVPHVRIEDAPRFRWRGVHLDVSRHFQPKREVLRMIDNMAAHKLNRLHLHLVDDQGWRIESRAYPLLHEVGSHRPRTASSHYGEELTYDEVPHGGYYTLADLAEIGAYARARGVVVVPEIDVPGHASAILAAYPAFGAKAGDYAVLGRWGISPAILSPLPATIDFLITIFDELLEALGPTPYVHIGGDECVLDDWVASEEIMAFGRTLGLESAGDLHAWFLRRLADALAERGSRAVVWDEAFVSGMLRDDTVVMPWRGTGVARRVAAAGHEVVQTPVFPTYFDYIEAGSEAEPLGIGETITVDDVVAYEPAPEDWSEEELGRIAGTQFQLWSERIPDARTLDYRAWPRGAALAEIAWSGRQPDFRERLVGHLARLDAMGVEYRPLAGPHPWQRGGAGRRRHRPGVIDIQDVMARLEKMTLDADSTRPSM